MNKSMIGALVIAMALLPSFASATNTAYDVNVGMVKLYQAPGVSSVAPTLAQSQGLAQIASSSFVVDHWEVFVECRANSPARCLGDIVT